MRIRIRPHHLIGFGAWLLIATFLYVCLQYYVGGDREKYIMFYETASRSGSLLEKYVKYNQILDAIEPLYFSLIYVSSQIIPKDILDAASGSLFLLILFSALRRIQSPAWFSVAVVLGFYPLILIFEVERLRYAASLFILGFMFSGWRRVILISISPFFQFQMVLPLVALVMWRGANSILPLLSLRIQKSLFYQSFLSLVLLPSVVLVLFGPYILGKLSYYSAGVSGLLELAGTAIFMVLAILLRQRPFSVAFVFLPFLLSAFIVGSGRINMLSYAAVFMVSYPLTFKKIAILSPVVLYFNFKALTFFSSVLTEGEGAF